MYTTILPERRKVATDQSWLQSVWNDSVWSKVIASLIAAALITVVSKLSQWPKRIWKPKPALRKTEAYASDQSTDPTVSYPLKYYLEAVKDSRKCTEVRVTEYMPNVVTLQKFVTNTLQVNLSGWCPRPLAGESVALLPNQRCRAWIGVDAKKFSKADLEILEGKIGTLILTANGKRIPFEI
jgi:hypothetical protein